MEHFLNLITYWHWWVLAAVLLIIEVLTGGGFLFWIGVSAVITGVIACLLPKLAGEYQLIIFAIGAICIAIVWWNYLRRHPTKTDDKFLNRRSEQYIGRVFNLETPVINGRGTIKVDDTMWRVQCEEDLPAGVKVKIIAIDGVLLRAERA